MPRGAVCGITLLLICLGVTGLAAAQDSDNVGSADAKAPAQAVVESTVKVKVPPKYDVDRIGDRGIGKGINFFSLNRERAMGEAMSRDLDAHLHLVGDPGLNAYVNRVVQNLVIHSDAKVPFTVRVVKDDEVNAFSLPGGFLYVNSGLIEAAPDEATFAGILAHEVAHVAARHATRTMTRRMMLRMASIPLMFLTGGAATAINATASFAVPISNMKFTRNSEREADLLGLEYAYAAGYDPEAFVQFFETIQSRQQHKMPRLMSLMFISHPMTDDRIKRAQEAISTMLPEKTNYVIDTSDFRQAKARLFQVLQTPCRREDGRPALLRAGKRCSDSDPDDHPTLRRRVGQVTNPGSRSNFIGTFPPSLSIPGPAFDSQ